MSNLNSELKKILADLDNNIKDKEDLEYTKIQIFNLYNLFFEEITNLETLANSRVSEIAKTQSDMDEKLEIIQKSLKGIEQDIYMDEEDDEDYNFSIVCPYCDNEFEINLDEVEDKVTCPKCKNVVELDWGCDCEEDDECGGNCDSCTHTHLVEDDDM